MATPKDETWVYRGNKRRMQDEVAEALTRLGYTVLVVKRGDEKRLAHLIKGSDYVFCDEPVRYLEHGR